MKRRSASSALTDSASFPLSASRCSCAPPLGVSVARLSAAPAARGAPPPPSSPRWRGSPPRPQSAPGRLRTARRSARPGPSARKRRGAGCARWAPERLPQRSQASGHCAAEKRAAQRRVSVHWCIRRPPARGADARDAAVGLAGLVDQGSRFRGCAGAPRERCGWRSAKRCRAHQAQTQGCRAGFAARRRGAKALHTVRSRPWRARGSGPRRSVLRHRRPLAGVSALARSAPESVSAASA